MPTWRMEGRAEVFSINATGLAGAEVRARVVDLAEHPAPRGGQLCGIAGLEQRKREPGNVDKVGLDRVDVVSSAAPYLVAPSYAPTLPRLWRPRALPRSVLTVHVHGFASFSRPARRAAACGPVQGV